MTNREKMLATLERCAEVLRASPEYEESQRFTGGTLDCMVEVRIFSEQQVPDRILGVDLTGREKSGF